MKIIQIAVQENEFETLSQRALEGGWPSVPEYVKSVLLPDNDFKRWFPFLIKQIERLPSGTVFTVSTLAGQDWDCVPKGVRLALGRVFFNQVAANKIPGIRSTGNKISSSQRYIKEDI